MERFSLSQTKTMISKALETTDILTEACSKHSFLVLIKHSAFRWMFTDPLSNIVVQSDGALREGNRQREEK